MNLFYFKADIGNFGDDLNPWLWPQVFGDLKGYRADVDFVGVGSVLDERLNNTRHKIIFGSGVRGRKPGISTQNCDIRFVRGPLSSKYLEDVPYITDSAYCLKLLPTDFSQKKTYSCSVIPYFRHINRFNWRMFEKISGIHFIDVSQPVEFVLEEIAKSEKVIAGAMHGAIVADALRIPWVRLKFGKHGFESFQTSELKWNDWLLSIGQEDSSFIEIPAKLTTTGNNFIKEMELYYKMLTKMINWSEFHLSSEELITRRIEQLSHAVEEIRKDYKE